MAQYNHPHSQKSKHGHGGGHRDLQPKTDVGALKEKWIKEGIDQEGIDFAETLGKDLAAMRLTSSQFRNIYSEIKRIQSAMQKEKTAFLLLRPKVAYAKGRDGGKGMELFEKVFSKAHKWVGTQEEETFRKEFTNFADLMEAILAFHKANEKK